MKKISFMIIVLGCLIFLIFVTDITDAADVFKWIRVGSVRFKVWDTGEQSETSGTRQGNYYYPCGSRNQFFYNDRFLLCAGSRWGCNNWTDELGKFYPVRLAGVPYGSSDNPENQFSIPLDEFDNRIKVYWRYQPPTIVVDGYVLNEPFQAFEEVAPEKIMGSADIMTETHMRTWMGMDIYANVLGWNQHNHDDYVIWDWTVVNTGNVDRDDEIELPTQTLTGLYFMRQAEYFVAQSMREWTGVYGQHPGDSLRIMYNYGTRRWAEKYDRTGYPYLSKDGYLRSPVYGGEVTIHRDTAYDNETDDITQPQMTSQSGPDDLFLKHESGRRGEAEWLTAYEIMQNGYHNYHNLGDYEPGAYPGTHHDIPLEQRGKKYMSDFDWFFWHQVINNSSGPYTLPIGEDLHFIWASVGGSISPRVGWEVGTAWYKDEAEPPPGMVFGLPETDNMPPQYEAHPDLYNNPAYKYAGPYSNWAKDCWVFTGRDSVFQNADNAYKNYQVAGYDVPVPPAPPSIEIRSLPDKIRIMWDGTWSEKASDFAGYRIYRAVPTSDSTWWEMIADISGSGTYQYDDATAERGVGYIFYVTAYDDGIGNATDVNGRREVLESGMWINQTDLQKAYLTRTPADELSDIRVVPNPFNIVLGEADMHYPGEERKIMFLDLPGYCTIKIYSESGDLVRTLEHTSGAGDEAWGVLEEDHMTSDSDQVVVSGIYIALIEENNEDGTSTGKRHFVKFVIVR